MTNCSRWTTDSQFYKEFAEPQPNAAQGAYNGVEAVSFDITDNLIQECL